MKSREWRVGDTLTPVEMTYSLEKFQQFMDAIHTGQEVKNPINVHTDEAFAKSLGLPGAIGFGQQMTAQIYRLLRANFGDGMDPPGSISVTYGSAFYDGDVVLARGVVVDVVDVPSSGGLREVLVDVWCENSSGARIVGGRAVARVAGATFDGRAAS